MSRPLDKGWAALGLVVALAGCFGTPTPLAPGLAGSIGRPHHGVQTGAVELPVEGRGFARYRRRGENHWAQPPLVRAIAESAAEVDRAFPGGAPLLIGDLSARHGGKIARHNTHRSGRDVDLLWYVTTTSGRSVRNPAFVHMRPNGTARAPRSRQTLKLDLERQWALVRSLLKSPHVAVQWMFCSAPVEKLLIDYARQQGEEPSLIDRATSVLLQPPDSLSHDDHIHLRVACSAQASIRGCEGGGPLWNWISPSPQLGQLPAGVWQQLAQGPSLAHAQPTPSVPVLSTDDATAEDPSTW